MRARALMQARQSLMSVLCIHHLQKPYRLWKLGCPAWDPQGCSMSYEKVRCEGDEKGSCRVYQRCCILHSFQLLIDGVINCNDPLAILCGELADIVKSLIQH